MEKQKSLLKFPNFEKSNQNTYLFQRPLAYPYQWVQKGDLLGDCSTSDKGELALGKNLLVGYMPWEGFNFEDAILINEKILFKYISLHIEKYEIEIDLKMDERLNEKSVIKVGSWVKEGDILAKKIVPRLLDINSNYEKLLYDIVGEKISEYKEKFFFAPTGFSGRVIRISSAKDIFPVIYEQLPKNVKNIFNPKKLRKNLEKPKFFISVKNFPVIYKNFISNDTIIIEEKVKYQFATKKIIIYIAIKHQFEVGDKMSGRHGNKGIISKILLNSDMPYLSNGTSLDVLLNPLGVPSRMNVGQIFECLLGFIGKIFQTKFKILCFNETIHYEASRSAIYSKFFELRQKTNYKWLFSKKTPGKFHLFDGRNGQLFHQSVLVGSSYLMKLIHVVDEKIHARATGPYSFITQQPLRGRGKHGGQRFGEMEVWALQGFGCTYILQELLTIKSDDIKGRSRITKALLKNTSFRFTKPESLRVVLRELQSLCLELQFF